MAADEWSSDGVLQWRNLQLEFITPCKSTIAEILVSSSRFAQELQYLQILHLNHAQASRFVAEYGGIPRSRSRGALHASMYIHLPAGFHESPFGQRI